MGKILLHWTYFEMVREELETARRVDKIELKLLQLIETWPPVRDRSQLVDLLTYHYQPKRRHSVIKSTLLSAMMLEAFINSIAKQKLPRFERESLDKLDVASKWVITLRLAFGEGPAADSGLIQKISALQKQRNFLMHAKPLEIKDVDEMYALGKRIPPAKTEKAESAWQTCLDALNEIQRVAPTFEKENFDMYMPVLERGINLLPTALRFETDFGFD